MKIKHDTHTHTHTHTHTVSLCMSVIVCNGSYTHLRHIKYLAFTLTAPLACFFSLSLPPSLSLSASLFLQSACTHRLRLMTVEMEFYVSLLFYCRAQMHSLTYTHTHTHTHIHTQLGMGVVKVARTQVQSDGLLMMIIK